MKNNFTKSITLLLLMLGLYSCKKEDQTTTKTLLVEPSAPVRYRDSVFATVDASIMNVSYRIVKNFDIVEDLKLDIYSPANDTATKRAALIILHGGAYSRPNPAISGEAGTRKSARGMATAYAKRGYVVFAISYRRGKDFKAGQSPADSSMKVYEAIYRAVQDSRAAIRCIKSNANSVKIDPDKLFIFGGGATNVVYTDQNEVGNTFSSWGPLDGTGKFDYPGYNVKVKGTINIEGAMINGNWINAGDPPVFSCYGTLDRFYYDSKTLVSIGYPLLQFTNGIKIHERLSSLGINCPPIVLYPGRDHGVNGTDPVAFNNTLNLSCDWMYNLLLQ